MKIAFYTSGISGIGRLVHGISLFNAFARRGIPVDFTILSSTPSERLSILSGFPVRHISLPPEAPDALSLKNYFSSHLFSQIDLLKPDVLVVDRMWFTLYHMIPELKCRKIFVTGRVVDSLFSVSGPEGALVFDPMQYNRVIGIEPFLSSVQMEHIDPLVIRNHSEILYREEALGRLGFTGDKKVCFIGMNFQQGYFDRVKEKYSYLEAEGWDVCYSTNLYGEGLFPLADYYNAVDLVIGSATYNLFWETRYFNKEAVLEPVPVRFCDQKGRLNEYSDHNFSINGADTLADIILHL